MGPNRHDMENYEGLQPIARSMKLKFGSQVKTFLLASSLIGGISDSLTKIRCQMLTESICLQFRDFRTVILVFSLSTCITVSIVCSKDRKNFEDFEYK